MATPRRIADVLGVTGVDVGLHLHETRHTGLVNLYAGVQLGVRRFDTSVGGVGGSPFAAGAAGNVATEEAVALLDDLGYDTGLDVEALIRAALLLEEMLGHPVPSRVAHAGPRTRTARS
jgi:hydroxymethylglutaryl-CoA lyase